MIEVEALSKNYGTFPALKNASFKIGKEHGVTALLGPNGAGKTTTLRLLTGFLSPTSGSIKINGIKLNSSNHVAIKKQIGYLPETTPLYEEMLIAEYVRFIGKARGLSDERLEKNTNKMIELLSLGSHLNTPLSLLSKGFRQRVALAATLIHDPKYIILDEPTSGLDPNQIRQIRHLIKELGIKQTLILSTHILQEVEDICDRVIILSRGEVVADETTSTLRELRSCRVMIKGTGVQTALMAMDVVKECRLLSKKDKSFNMIKIPKGYEVYFCELKEDKPEKLFRQIATTKGWEVKEFALASRSLQEVFHELTV